MAAVTELIRKEADGTLSFGDYTLDCKKKLEDFPAEGDLYKVKTYHEITKLERNGLFVYESVPGTAVTHFAETDEEMHFTVSGTEDAQITVEMSEEEEYEVRIDGASIGTMKTNLGGKLSFNVELEAGKEVLVEIIHK